MSQTPPQTGEQAPDFTLPCSDGRDVTLSALGKPAVLFFYLGRRPITPAPLVCQIFVLTMSGTAGIVVLFQGVAKTLRAKK